MTAPAMPISQASPAAVSERKKSPFRWIIYVLLAIFAMFFLTPLYVAIITSFKSMGEVSRTDFWAFPTAPTFENFSLAFDKLRTGLFNSIFLTLPGVIISCILGSMNGYVLSKWKFRGSNVLFTLILFGMFIPYQSVLLPLELFLQGIGLYGNIPGLILTHVVYGIPITTLIFRNYYAGVPKELVESGTIDGAGFFGIYKNIIFPLSVPAFVVVLIWQFTALWNEFLFAVSLNSNPNTAPVTVALSGLGSSTAGINYGMQMAGALITALPTLLVYIFLSRYFIRGLLAGSVKG